MEKALLMLKELTAAAVVLRLFLALVFGGILGAERGLRHRPAGFTTYVLVCVGSAIIMLTDQYVCSIYPQADPTRLAAQVVSGIGFLGAGTIIVTRTDEIRGLTTAAGLWLAAGLGLALGAGFYWGAIIGFLFAVFAIIQLKKIDTYIKEHARNMEIYMEYNASFSLRKLSELAEEHRYNLQDVQRGRVKTLNKEFGTLVFAIEFSQKQKHSDVINVLYTLEGVEYLREVL